MHKQITYSAEPSVIGVDNGFCQIEFLEEDLREHEHYKIIKQITLKTDVNDFLRIQERIDFSKITPLKGTLLKKAKVTDFMVFAPFFHGCKYVISQKVVDCFKMAGIPKEEYKLMKVIIEGVKTNFYLLFVPLISTEQIDFTNSLLYPEEDALSDKKNYFSIETYDEYKNLIKTNYFNRWQSVGLGNKYHNKYLINIQSIVELFFCEDLIACIQKSDVNNFEIPHRQIKLVFSMPNKSVPQVRL